MEYLKGKIDDRQTNSKTENIRGVCRAISDFKKG
jgi:hypothetical protein